MQRVMAACKPQSTPTSSKAYHRPHPVTMSLLIGGNQLSQPFYREMATGGDSITLNREVVTVGHSIKLNREMATGETVLN